MSIGTRLKEARKDAKLSQEELAAKSGVSQSAISDLERGKSAGTTSLASLASACSVRALWLETGKGPRTESASDARSAPPAAWFSEDAHKLLEIYFSLDDEQRADAMRMMIGYSSGLRRSSGSDAQS